MRVFLVALLSGSALFSLLQTCPAPFAAGLGAALGMASATITAADSITGAAVSGAIAGGIGHASRVRRAAADLPAGVSQESWQQCQDSLQGSNIHLSGTVPDNVLVSGVPAPCMDLATVLTGKPSQDGGPVPVPMGSDSLKYSGLSRDNMKDLARVLKTKGI